MIRRIFIIDNIGSIIYSKSFVEQKTDIHLISGFLASIGMFAEQTSSGNMDSIRFKSTKFIFSTDYALNIRFILELDAEDSEVDAKKRIEEIKGSFRKVAKNKIDALKEKFVLDELEIGIFEKMLSNFQQN